MQEQVTRLWALDLVVRDNPEQWSMEKYSLSDHVPGYQLLPWFTKLALTAASSGRHQFGRRIGDRILGGAVPPVDFLICYPIRRYSVWYRPYF